MKKKILTSLIASSFLLTGCMSEKPINPNYRIDDISNNSVAVQQNELTKEEERLKKLSLAIFEDSDEEIKKQAQELFNSEKGLKLLKDHNWLTILNLAEMIGLQTVKESAHILIEDNPKLLSEGEFSNTEKVSLPYKEEHNKPEIREFKNSANEQEINTPVTRKEKMGGILLFDTYEQREDFLVYLNSYKRKHNLNETSIGSTIKGEILFFNYVMTLQEIEDFVVELTTYGQKEFVKDFFIDKTEFEKTETNNFEVELIVK